jgi:tetratricopeptide (TPR) repeat protein
LLLEACDALYVAHARGVIHRDVKPSNLFVVNDTKRLKLLDFGLACAHRSIDTLTASGVAVGTPGYMAPEQVRGDGGIGPAADVFSLGCVLFECLTGRPAFGGRHTTAIFSKILMEPAPSLQSYGARVSPALDALVQRMLAKDPSQRPRNARALAEEVQLLIEREERGASASVPPASMTGREQGLLCVLMGRFGYEAAVAEAAHGALPVAANQRLRAVALRYGGHLDFMSNGVFVVVFRPDAEVTLAATDLANRAAQCALALHRVMPSAPLALGTGVGMASSASLIGDVIDRATLLLHSQIRARAAFSPDALEEQLDGAEAAQAIHVDAVTAGLLESRFELITPGGRAGYLVGMKHQRDAGRLLLGKPTACVGREREISRLEALLDECSDERVARVVLITAAPGLGKSRVRHEFIRRLRDRPRTVSVWQAWAEATRAGSPFELLAQIVRGALGLEEGEPPEIARAKVRAGVEEAVGGSDAARVGAFLGELVGVGFGDSAQLAAARREPRLMGDQIGRAWHDFLAGECARAPVLIVLEDVHWGDAGSLKWIDSALRHVEGRALLVMALGRPHVTELFPGLWQGRGLFHMALPPLSRRASEELASAALGMPEASDALRRIVSRAEGNAFYLEELIRAEAEGRGDELPGTVLAMVQARFARLAPAARQLLRAGSIFGESFWDEAVLALGPSGAPSALHQEQLRTLVQAEWLIKKPESRLARQAEYAFQHALLRDAAYASLTDDDRRLGHALAGAWLERNRERDPLTLAEHFKRGGELPRAASWYERAAALALKGDLGGAIEHAEQAVQCGASGAMLGRLRVIQAEAQNWRGEHAEAARTATEALQHLEPSGSDAERWAHAINQSAWANGTLGNHTEVTRWARLLFERSRERCSDLHVVALAFCAMHLIDGGNMPDAELISSWLHARAAKGIEDPLASAAVNQLLGHTNLSEDLCEALWRYEAAGRDLQRAEDERQLQTTIETAGLVYLMLGQYERAESAFRSSLAIADRLGLAREISLINLALARARLGAVVEARELLLQILDDREHGAKVAGYLHATLADVEIAAGSYDSALEHARFGLSVDTRPLQAYALSLSSRAELGLGRKDRALDFAIAAVALADSTVPIQEYEPLARLVYAEARMACGDQAAARLAIRAARDAVSKRAAYLDEPELRHGFLTRVPENIRILALASDWLGE